MFHRKHFEAFVLYNKQHKKLSSFFFPLSVLPSSSPSVVHTFWEIECRRETTAKKCVFTSYKKNHYTYRKYVYLPSDWIVVIVLFFQYGQKEIWFGSPMIHTDVHVWACLQTAAGIKLNVYYFALYRPSRSGAHTLRTHRVRTCWEQQRDGEKECERLCNTIVYDYKIYIRYIMNLIFVISLCDTNSFFFCIVVCVAACLHKQNNRWCIFKYVHRWKRELGRETESAREPANEWK